MQAGIFDSISVIRSPPAGRPKRFSPFTSEKRSRVAASAVVTFLIGLKGFVKDRLSASPWIAARARVELIRVICALIASWKAIR
jgi:hypothetical protein